MKMLINHPKKSILYQQQLLFSKMSIRLFNFAKFAAWIAIRVHHDVLFQV